MKINVNSVDYEIDAPKYGYITTINTALIVTPLLPSDFAIWDNGSTNMSRTVRFKWLLSATDTDTLLEIFNNITKGRGVELTLKLGTDSGIFPFGADYGDSGNFGVQLIGLSALPVQEEPWLYFSVDAEFIMTSKPAYSLPAEIAQGDLQIGNISNLRYPPDMPNSYTDYGFSTQIAYDGTPYTVDKLADSYTTNLNMLCNESKTAAIIDDLVETIRDSTCSIVAPSNNYIFGRECDGDAIYTCRWLNESISITHNRFNEFSFGLNFYRISQA